MEYNVIADKGQCRQQFGARVPLIPPTLAPIVCPLLYMAYSLRKRERRGGRSPECGRLERVHCIFASPPGQRRRRRGWSCTPSLWQASWRLSRGRGRTFKNPTHSHTRTHNKTPQGTPQHSERAWRDGFGERGLMQFGERSLMRTARGRRGRASRARRSPPG